MDQDALSDRRVSILHLGDEIMNLKKELTESGLALSMMIGLAFPADAIVYTSSNEAEGNRVIAFDIKKRSGNLVEIGSFDTGGTGTGAPIGNQAALATDASDRWMFVTNAGDGSVTSFRLQEEGLQFVNKVPSGGASAISVTVFGTLVYVLNEGDGFSDDPFMRYDNISGFRFNPVGELEPIPHSRRIVDKTQLTSPAQVGFNKSGTVLLVTEKATDTISTWFMADDGTPADTPLKRPSAVPTPFGFEFGDRDYVFITEANGGGQGVTASYRVNRETGAVSSLVDLIEQGDATCWTVLNGDQTVGYSVNTGSGTVSPYHINFDGTIDPFYGYYRHYRYGDLAIATGNGPRDAVLTQNNQFFYTLNNGDGEIRAFRVRRDGKLKRRGTVPVPTSVSGIIAR
jgi:6-phosphogluconolactonase (cycloisomerase 2 family)